MSQTKYYLSATCLGVIIFLFLQGLRGTTCRMSISEEYTKRSRAQLKGNYNSRLSYSTLHLLEKGKYSYEEKEGVWKISNTPKKQILILTDRYGKETRLQVTAYGLQNVQTMENFVKKRHY